jgi:hypothetical protein
MGGYELIERYLRELDAALQLPPATRSRIVAEARDHLYRLAPAAEPPDAQTAVRAIDAFGPPALVAERFARELAVGSSRRAVRRGAVLLALALVLWDACTNNFVHTAGWLADGPGTLVIWLVAQVGVVAGVTSLVWSRAAQPDDAVVRLRFAVRGLAVLVICCVLTLALVAASLLAEPAAIGSVVLVAALGVGCGAATAAAAAGAWRAQRRLATVADSARPTATGREVLVSLADAVAAGWLRLQRAVRRHGVRPAPRRHWVGPWAAHLARALDPSRHPWRYAAAVALLAGLMVPIQGVVVLVAQGRAGASQLGQLALYAPLMVAFEAVLLLAGYATLGRYLGLRRSRTSAAAIIRIE